MEQKYWFEVLGGILIVISSVVGEQMHRKMKWGVYLLFLALAVIYVFFGIRIDKASAAREAAAETQARQSQNQVLGLDKQLIDAQHQLISKSDEIAALNRDMFNSVTGGTEFAYLDPLIADDNQQHRIFLIIAHRGKYPIYDVGFRVLDFRQGGHEPMAAEMLSNNFNVGTLAPRQLRFVAYWPIIPGKTHYAFNFFFTARNAAGFVMQEVRYVKVKDNWLSATNVTPFNSQRVLYRHVDAGFPTDAKGQIDWNDAAYSE